MNRIDNPCYQCQMRTSDCHPRCELYSDFQQKLKAENEVIALNKLSYPSYRRKGVTASKIFKSRRLVDGMV